MVNLNWIKCNNGGWCKLLTVNLEHDHFNNMEGVYIIWHAGPNPATVRVGQGIIKDRLDSHRNDDDILSFENLELFVTWASVSDISRDGVEKFLADTLNPRVGSKFPDVNSTPVNLPW